METKHAPSTPLPWTASVDDGDHCIKGATGQTTFCDMQYYPWCEGRDFDYIVRACNAYPQMVNALKQVSDLPECSGWVKEFLRELGEL